MALQVRHCAQNTALYSHRQVLGNTKPTAARLPFTLLLMTELGRMLLILGAILVVAGLVLMLSGRSHFPLGRLPGDIIYRGKHSTVYFPIVTSILLSVVLSLLLYVVSRFRR
jgi:Protein of unknown function (DUF2905)